MADTVTPHRTGSLSGLTDVEAKEFHRIFISSFAIFIVVAVIAHILAWIWRPWLPGAHGYQMSMLDSVHGVATHAFALLG